MIAVETHDVAAHVARLRSGGYRPARCPTCGHGNAHVHDYRSRLCQIGDTPIIRIVRYRCARKDCRARWQILPRFLARHVHFNWPVVEEGVRGEVRARRRQPCKATLQRWRARMASSARRLARLLSDTGGRLAGRISAAMPSSRLELVDVLNTSFASLAAQVHLLMPGVRLM